MNKEKVRAYAERDVGKIWGEIVSADDEGLEDLSVVGSVLGHVNVLDEVYLEKNCRNLKKAGASEDEISSMRIADRKGDIYGYLSAFQRRGIESDEPRRHELLYALLNSVDNRGVDLDEKETSTGMLYQRAYGAPPNFNLMGFMHEGREIPYTALGEKDRLQFRKAVITHQVKTELARGSRVVEKPRIQTQQSKSLSKVWA